MVGGGGSWRPGGGGGVGGVEGLEDFGGGLEGVGEAVGCRELVVLGGGAVEERNLLLDLGLGDVEREGGERDFQGFGDVGEGEGGVAEACKEGLLLVGGGVEGEGGHGVIVRFWYGLSIGFWTQRVSGYTTRGCRQRGL